MSHKYIQASQYNSIHTLRGLSGRLFEHPYSHKDKFEITLALYPVSVDNRPSKSVF